MRIIYICTSNVCRSPVAEALAKAYLEENKIEGVEVVSRGLTDRYEPQDFKVMGFRKKNRKVVEV